MFYQFGIPSSFCQNCWPPLEGGKNGTHEIKKVDSTPHVTLYNTPLSDYVPHFEVKKWVYEQLPNYDRETITVVNGPERTDPFFYFHNVTTLAVTPIGEAFDNATHPTITVNNPYSVDKFMNLSFNKTKLKNMTMEEIDDLAQGMGAFKRVTKVWNEETNQFEEEK